MVGNRAAADPGREARGGYEVRSFTVANFALGERAVVCRVSRVAALVLDFKGSLFVLNMYHFPFVPGKAYSHAGSADMKHSCFSVLNVCSHTLPYCTSCRNVPV